MPESKTFQRRRRDLWLLRAVALVITLLLWVTVLGGKKIEIVKRVSLDYQIPKNLVISNQVPQEVTFRIAGARAFLKEFSERSITIPINLRKSQEGDYEVTIREEMLEIPIGLKVTAISQSVIPVKLDRLSSKRVPVRAILKDEVPELKIRSVTVQPSTVEVFGPRQRLKMIEAVPTDPISVTIDSVRETFTAKLNLSDFSGVKLGDSEHQVEVTIQSDGAWPKRWVKDIAVGVRINRPNATVETLDLKKLNLRVRPQTVNLYLEGEQKKLDTITADNVEVWVELGDLSPGIHRSRLVWSLPPDLRVARRSSDWVEVVIPVQ